MNPTGEQTTNPNLHIDVLDGIRALTITIIVWFHFWQQCWLMPIVQTPALSFLGIHEINLDWIPRTGGEMVTLMIFLSAFCLALPFANHKTNKTPLPSWSTFYKKRIARILPSYLFCILVITVYNLVTNAYRSPDFVLNGESGFFLKDLLSHLSFTHILFPDVQSFTLLNGVLWTVAVEVQFYIIFPILSKCFFRKPVLTYCSMNLIAYAYVQYAIHQENIPFLLHQLPSYFGVFANGFLGALIFVGLPKNLSENKSVRLLSTIISIGCLFAYKYFMLDMINAYENLNKWQLQHRFPTSVLYLVFVISTALSLRGYRAIFSNAVMRFIAGISYNLYIWHQWLCVTLKENHIPFYEGTTPPNELDDRPWMWKFFILSVVASLFLAIATTYLIEKPCAKLLRREK